MIAYEPHEEAPDLLSVQAAAARVAISEQTLMRHVTAGRVAAYKVGGSVRIRSTDIDAFALPYRSG
jgi:excisionase family DNA binding protein